MPLLDGVFRRRALRCFTALVCAAGLSTQVACYSYLPMRETPPNAGKSVSVVLNDRGRVQVSDQLGESIDVVEGELSGAEESAVRVRVKRTVTLRGVSTVWTGEEVQIPREGIRGFQERQYSRSRSVMFAALAVVGVVLVASAITLLVGGGGKPGDGNGCTVGCPEQ